MLPQVGGIDETWARTLIADAAEGKLAPDRQVELAALAKALLDDWETYVRTMQSQAEISEMRRELANGLQRRVVELEDALVLLKGP